MDEQEQQKEKDLNPESAAPQEENAAASVENPAEVSLTPPETAETQTGETATPPEPTAEEKLKQAEENVLRVRAEFANYQKRMAKETVEMHERAKASVISSFLPVYDFFQMAMTHAAQTPDIKVLKQGMDMILNEFTKAFDNLGLKEVPAVGQPFDPHVHEAVKSEASDAVPEGKIIAQWKAGYKIGDLLVRPAMVVVSSGPAASAEPAAPAEESPAE